jgi:hypothetical protein
MIHALVAAMLAACAFDVDNPEYKLWSGSKPGSFVKMQNKIQGSTLSSEVTATVLEVTAAKVVLEVKTKLSTGKELTSKREIPARVKEAPSFDRVTEGEEEIAVAGKKLKCRTVETVKKDLGSTYTTKTWLSDAVPGQVVRRVQTIEGPVPSKSESVALEFAAK